MKRKSCLSWISGRCYFGMICRDKCKAYSRKGKKKFPCKHLRYQYDNGKSRKKCKRGHAIKGYCPEKCPDFRRKNVR